MLDAHLPSDLQSLLDAELRPSETVLWATQPSRERWTRPNILFGSIIGSLIDRLGMMPRIIYCITNQRAIIVSMIGAHPYIYSLEPDVLKPRNITPRPNGLNDIVFPNAPTKSVKFSRGQVGFYGIADVRSVDDLIGRTFDGMPPQGTASKL